MFVRLTLGLLVPKGAYLLAAGIGIASTFLANVAFSNTITTGALITAALVVVLSGIFTFRNNMRTFWKNLADEREAQIEQLEAHLAEANQKLHEQELKAAADLAAFSDEQRALRHELKNELAAVNATLTVERAKTDLTALMEQLGTQHKEAMGAVAKGLDKQDQILQMLSGNNDRPGGRA